MSPAEQAEFDQYIAWTRDTLNSAIAHYCELVAAGTDETVAIVDIYRKLRGPGDTSHQVRGLAGAVAVAVSRLAQLDGDHRGGRG